MVPSWWQGSGGYESRTTSRAYSFLEVNSRACLEHFHFENALTDGSVSADCANEGWAKLVLAAHSLVQRFKANLLWLPCCCIPSCVMVSVANHLWKGFPHGVSFQLIVFILTS